MPTMRFWAWGALLLAVCLASSSARAQLQAENLVQTMPKGFKPAFNKTQNGMLIQEWVPDGQTVDDWSDMVTTQIFYGRKDWDPAQFLNTMAQRWVATCKGPAPDQIATGQANGYTVSMVLLHCPLNPKTGKPETALMRAIKGNDSFYLVQWAMRAPPGKDEVAKMAKYLGAINVCDTRSPQHPCPDLKAQGFTPIK